VFPGASCARPKAKPRSTFEFFQAEDAGFLTPSLFGDDIEPRQVVAQTVVFDVPPDVAPLLALFVEGSADQPTGERVGVDLSKEDPEAVTPEDLIHYAYALRLQGDAGGEKFYELLDSSSQEQVSREQRAAYFDLVGREVSVVDEWVVTDVRESGDAATVSVNVRGGEPVPSESSESGVNCEAFQDSNQFDTVKADGAWRLVLGQETIQGIRDAA
jgi:hypothetical protein